MTYLAIDQLTQDIWFQARVRACTVQEAQNMRNDLRPPWQNLANDALRGGGATTLTFVRIIAAFPGLAESAEREPTDDDRRTVDHEKIGDDEILSQVQANWEVVAGLFWDPGGVAIGQAQ